jgi:hypothetical protein
MIIYDYHVNECTDGKNQILANGSNHDITEYTNLNILYKVNKNEHVMGIMCQSVFRSLFLHTSPKSNCHIFITFGTEQLRQRLWSPLLGKSL